MRLQDVYLMRKPESFCFLKSKVLEDLVHNRYAVTIFGELVMDEENNIVFKNNKFEFNNKLFDRKDILSILQVVEYGPGGRVF